MGMSDGKVSTNLQLASIGNVFVIVMFMVESSCTVFTVSTLLNTGGVVIVAIVFVCKVNVEIDSMLQPFESFVSIVKPDFGAPL